MTNNDGPDDVDAIFAHLERVAPPDDFVARVMARARQGEVARWPVWQRAGFAVLYVAALAGLAVLAYSMGSEMERTHLRDLLTLLVQDFSAVRDSPSIYLSAFRDAVPWQHLCALLADVVVLGIATRLLLKVATPREGSDVSGGAVGA